MLTILSPDGFPIRIEPFRTRTCAVRYFNKWKRQFTAQGYYSTANRERIDLADLADCCSLVTI